MVPRDRYMDSTAMPIYVTAMVIKILSKRRSGLPAMQVRMVGDGVPTITVDYYINKHPRPYVGHEDRYLLHPDVKILSEEPPTE